MPSRRTEPGPGARPAGAIGSRTERDAGPPPLGPGAGRAIDVWSGPACTTSCAAADRPGLPAREGGGQTDGAVPAFLHVVDLGGVHRAAGDRSEEHTSELQSRGHLVCRLLLEKKKHIHRASAGLLS